MLPRPRRCGMLRRCCGIPCLSTVTSRTRDPSSSCNHLSGRGGRKNRSRSRRGRARSHKSLRRNLHHLRPLWGGLNSLGFLLLLPHLGWRSQQPGPQHRGLRFPDRLCHQHLAGQYLAGQCHQQQRLQGQRHQQPGLPPPARRFRVRRRLELRNQLHLVRQFHQRQYLAQRSHQRRRLQGQRHQGAGRQHPLPPVRPCPEQQHLDLRCHLRRRRKQHLQKRHPQQRNLLWLDPQQPRLLPRLPHLGVRCRKPWPRGLRSRERHVPQPPNHLLLRRQRPNPLPPLPRRRNRQQPPHQGQCPLGRGRRHHPSQSRPRQNPRWRNRPSQSRR